MWQRTCWVAAALCALAVAVLVGVHELTRRNDPLNSPQLAALKARLVTDPANEALKEEIRALDLKLRQRHAWVLAVYRFGAWFLTGAAVVLVGVGKLWARTQAVPPHPRPQPDAAERHLRALSRARGLTAAMGAVALLALAAAGLSARQRLPTSPAELEQALAHPPGHHPGGAGNGAGAEPALLSPTEYAANWPRFLGPTGNAAVSNTALPLTFDLATGAGLRWKTPLTAPGFNSPLIWSNRVFLSGGTATHRSVFAFDLATGAPVWERAVTNVPGSPARPPEVPEMTGFAASTMATDGRRVYVWFANGDLAAFTLEGAPVWAKNLGVPENPYGHATSLVTWRDRLLAQFDQGGEDEKLSRLYALDGATGRVLWQKNRSVGASWATPVVFEAAGKTQIGTLGGEFVIAYDVSDGTELWRAKLLSGEITPSPHVVAGRFIGVSPSDRLFALRPDGAGEVTRSHLIWESDEVVPDITSPVSSAAHVFTVLSHGVVGCHDLETGKLLWEHELDFEVNATPALVGSRLYVFGTKGPVAVLEVGPAARVLARFDLGEGVYASPALAQGVMVVRTVKTLFCVGPERPPTPEGKGP